jgi:hypothetical protein
MTTVRMIPGLGLAHLFRRARVQDSSSVAAILMQVPHRYGLSIEALALGLNHND